MFSRSPVCVLATGASGCPCPNRVCIGHDSTISVVYPNADAPVVYSIRLPSLPLVSLTWTSENSIVAAGHDCRPLVFNGSEQGWQEAGTLDDSKGAGGSGFGAGTPGRLKTGAFATFRDADVRGQSGAGGAGQTDTKLLTIHQNTINSVRPYEVVGGEVTKVSTSGVDGNLVIWDTNEVSALATRLGGTQLR